MRRVVIPELLDSDEGSPKDIQRSLADLRNVNRWFGGIGTTHDLVESVALRAGCKHLSLLEVAAGSGDVPLVAAKRLRARGIQLGVTLLDRAESHLNGFRPAVVGDALRLPFRNESFDLVSCALFAHHLEPEEIVGFVEEGLRVCRVAVLINDLRRSHIHLALIYAGLPLFRSHITRHDSRASVRRSYTPDEMRALLGQTTAASAEVRPHYLCRYGAIAWKSDPHV